MTAVRHAAMLRCVAGIALALAASAVPAAERVLRVCADPNNLPFSDRAGHGFENRIAQILAGELHARVEYTWWAQRRGYARNTVRADKCDLWVGVARGVATLDTTQPYYRSEYVFVTRADRHLDDLRSFDDPRLRRLTIGVQMIGNDATNTPPAHALARRGITSNVRGFMVYGNYRDAEPEAPILRAVADGTVDVALVWGPLAGWFAQRSPVPLHLEPVVPQSDGPMPMAFDISVGVRRGDPALKRAIEQALRDRRGDIDAVLADYGVPRVAGRAPAALAAGAPASGAAQ